MTVTTEKVKEGVGKAKLIYVCPSRDSRIESRLEIAAVESLSEFITLKDKTTFMAVGNIRLLEMLITYPDLVDVELGLLTGVPGSDYTAQFESITWQLNRTGYDALVVELDAAERQARIKRDEMPHSASQMGGKDAYQIEVNDLKKPTAFDVVKLG